MPQTWKIIVRGKVQGVFYRQSTAEQASALGVTGTVRNLADGSVEVYAQGEPGQLEALVDWCKNGPPRAIVTSVSTDKFDLPDRYDVFRIVR